MYKSGKTASWLALPLLALLLGACNDQYVHVGECWAALDKLPPPANALKLEVKGPTSGAVGDKVQFTVTPQDNGYLWLVQIDSADQVQLLFPNEEKFDNRVEAGREYVFPGTLDKPTGVHLLAFVVTSHAEGLEKVLPAPVRDALPINTEQRVQPMGVTLDQGLRWGWRKQVLNVQ